MSSIFVEDVQLANKNRKEGISDYLNTLGKLWVTPEGPFATLSEVEEVTGLHRKTLLRRFKSKRVQFTDWYIISGSTELTESEVCEQCDELDDILFKEGCWLCNVEHTHGTPIEGNTKFIYLFEGLRYESTLDEWNSGLKYHKILGES